MQNWLSNFQHFSFQSSNFQFCHFNSLTFNCCQFCIPLDLSYLLPLSESKQRRFDFFFNLKKIKKTIIKKIIFSHFLSCRTLSLSFSFPISLSHNVVVQGLTATAGLHPQPPCHRRPPPLHLSLFITHSTKIWNPTSHTPSPPKSKSKENNLTPSPP